jgi:hypothetical protein
MKKFIFSLIFVVSTLFSFGQNPIMWGGYTSELTNGVSTSVDNIDLIVTAINPTSGHSLTLTSTDTNLVVELNININSGSIKFNGVTYTTSNQPPLLSSDDTLYIYDITGVFTITPNILNQVGIKNLEQRQLNLFTYNNKIKVNGQIDEKLTLNVFNMHDNLEEAIKSFEMIGEQNYYLGNGAPIMA